MTTATQPKQFTFADAHLVSALCAALQAPAFGATGKWLKCDPNEVFVDSAEEENDTINAPGFSVQVVTEDEEWLGITRTKTTYYASVPVTIPGGFMEPDDVDLRVIGDAHSLADAVGLVYAHACAEAFNNTADAVLRAHEESNDE